MKNKNKLFMALTATTMSAAILMSVEDVKANELNIANKIQDTIKESVALEATKHIELEVIAETYTNIDRFYEDYVKEIVGIKVVTVEDFNTLEKTMLLEVDLNKISQNFNKNISADNPFKETIDIFKSNETYLNELKTLSNETKNPLIIEQVVRPDLLKNKYEIKTTLKMGELYGDSEFDYIDILRYGKKTVKFSDIAGNGNEQHIKSLAEIGIVEGTNGKYNPNNNVTRAQFAAMLARTIPNADLQNKKSKFTDIGTHWAKNDIILLNQLGLVDGNTATTFNPNAPITRQQAAKILIRYTELFGINLEDVPTQLKFDDASKISDYAKEPVAKLNALGIISGSVDKNGKTLFKPTGNLTRGQFAKMLNGLLSSDVYSMNKK